MGKKKSDDDKVVNDIIETIDGNAFIKRPKIIIPFSPALDSISGGVPEGSFMILTGPPKFGKTVSALHFAAQAQKSEYNGDLCPDGRHVYFYDIEGRLKVRDLHGIPGLDLDRFHIIQSEPGHILHAEEFLQQGVQNINLVPGSINIIDSFSALCTNTELTASMSDQQRADVAKLVAKFCRKIANVIPVNRNIVIGITHMGANVSGSYGGLIEKSGFALRYAVDVKFRARSSDNWCIPDNSDNIVGLKTTWSCETSALNFIPANKVDSYIRFGHGIDEMQELLLISLDIGLVTRAGAWYTLSFLPEDEDGKQPKFQGAEKARQALIDNPEWAQTLRSLFKKRLGLCSSVI